MMAALNRRRPLLITGVPRAGTTWLARSLAVSAGTSLPGREPMNPRERQFALGGQLDGWVRVEQFNARAAALLRRCYAGREPRTYSRYGSRQWAAAFPGTRVIIKDPFALLSLAAIYDATQALPVVIYRHPAAVLGSYRRMGWTADTAELLDLGAPKPADSTDAAAMTSMWTWCHQIALQDLERVPDSLIVSHANLTRGGAGALNHLRGLLDLSPIPDEDDSPASSHPMHGDKLRSEGVLHDFQRSATELEVGWRTGVSDDEVDAMELGAAATWAALEARQVRFPSSETGP